MYIKLIQLRNDVDGICHYLDTRGDILISENISFPLVLDCAIGIFDSEDIYEKGLGPVSPQSLQVVISEYMDSSAFRSYCISQLSAQFPGIV